MKVIVAVVLCVMVSVITARPAVEDSLDEMNQASANVMATLKELQEKMLAEEGQLRFSLLSLYFSMDKKKFHVEKNSETWPRIEHRSLAYLSATVTSTLECFLYLCKAVIESYSCMGDSVQFVYLDENFLILEKN